MSAITHIIVTGLPWAALIALGARQLRPWLESHRKARAEIRQALDAEAQIRPVDGFRSLIDPWTVGACDPIPPPRDNDRRPNAGWLPPGGVRIDERRVLVSH